MSQKQVRVQITRETLDSHNPERLKFKSKPGINEEVVRKISSDKEVMFNIPVMCRHYVEYNSSLYLFEGMIVIKNKFFFLKHI